MWWKNLATMSYVLVQYTTKGHTQLVMCTDTDVTSTHIERQRQHCETNCKAIKKLQSLSAVLHSNHSLHTTYRIVGKFGEH